MRPGSVDYAAGARKHLSKIVFLVGSVSLSGKGNSSAQPLPAHVQRSTAVGTHTSIKKQYRPLHVPLYTVRVAA